MRLYLSALALLIGLSMPAGAAEWLIPLKPAKGFEIGIPHGWNACDDANQERLGRTATPPDFRTSVCGDPKTIREFRLMAFPPDTERAFAVYVKHSSSRDYDIDTVDKIDAASMRTISDQACKEIKTLQETDGASVDRCAVTIEKIGGKRAFVTRMSIREDEFVDSAETEEWEIPYEHGTVRLVFGWSKEFEVFFRPVMQRIKKSVIID